MGKLIERYIQVLPCTARLLYGVWPALARCCRFFVMACFALLRAVPLISPCCFAALVPRWVLHLVYPSVLLRPWSFATKVLPSPLCILSTPVYINANARTRARWRRDLWHQIDMRHVET